MTAIGSRDDAQTIRFDDVIDRQLDALAAAIVRREG